MRLKHVFRIGALELKRNKSLARRDFLLSFIPSLVLFGVIFLTLMTKGFFVGDEFYRLQTNDPDILTVFSNHPKVSLSVLYDVQILRNGERYIVDRLQNDKGRSALHTVVTGIKNYNHALYEQLPEHYAYPLRITTTYLNRNTKPGLTVKENQDGFDIPSAPEEALPSAPELDAVSTPSPAPSTAPVNDFSQVVDARPGPPEQVAPPQEISTAPGALPQLQGDGIPPSRLNALTSFASMYLAMVLIFPLTLVGIVYSNSVMQDKINRRIHVLLTSPVSKLELLVGKTFPHVILALISIFLIVFKITGFTKELPFVLFVALILTLVYLSIAFLVSTLARDAKEVSFFMIFFLSIYSFLLLIPTFLTTISDISLISPLTIIARVFENGLTWNPIYALTLIPHVLVAITLFVFGASMFNEENLFGYRRVTQKMISGLTSLIRTPFHLFVFTAATVPFAFVFEMVLLLFILSTTNHLLVMVLLVAAFTEEALKCLGYWAVIKSRPTLTTKQVLLYGFMGGAGFFLLEKGSVLITITDLLQSYTLIVIGGLTIPLMIHTGLGIMFFALTKHLGKDYARSSYLVVSMLHFIINMSLVGLAT